VDPLPLEEGKSLEFGGMGNFRHSCPSLLPPSHCRRLVVSKRPAPASSRRRGILRIFFSLHPPFFFLYLFNLFFLGKLPVTL
jgi:hypothetical protein